MNVAFSTARVSAESISCFATTGSTRAPPPNLSSKTRDPTPACPYRRTSRSMSVEAKEMSSPDVAPEVKKIPGTIPPRLRCLTAIFPDPSRGNTSMASPSSSAAFEGVEGGRRQTNREGTIAREARTSRVGRERRRWTHPTTRPRRYPPDARGPSRPRLHPRGGLRGRPRAARRPIAPPARAPEAPARVRWNLA